MGRSKAAALLGRGECGWSIKGEKADIKGFAEGLNPSGALTAIISAHLL